MLPRQIRNSKVRRIQRVYGKMSICKDIPVIPEIFDKISKKKMQEFC